MNKKITLIMQDNKDILVVRDEELIITILKNNRIINAKNIFELFDYNLGDTYDILTENEKKLDVPVINFFRDLLIEIATQISDYKEDEDEYACVLLNENIKDNEKIKDCE